MALAIVEHDEQAGAMLEAEMARAIFGLDGKAKTAQEVKNRGNNVLVGFGLPGRSQPIHLGPRCGGSFPQCYSTGGRGLLISAQF